MTRDEIVTKALDILIEIKPGQTYAEMSAVLSTALLVLGKLTHPKLPPASLTKHTTNLVTSNFSEMWEYISDILIEDDEDSN